MEMRICSQYRVKSKHEPCDLNWWRLEKLEWNEHKRKNDWMPQTSWMTALETLDFLQQERETPPAILSYFAGFTLQYPQYMKLNASAKARDTHAP